MLGRAAGLRVFSACDFAGEPPTLRGIGRLLRRCVASLRPEYISVSTPHDFEYRPCGGVSGADSVLSAAQTAALDALLTPEAPPSSADVMNLLLLPLCHEEKLPLLMRMGTCRGVNAPLGLAGDGVGKARLEALAALCSAHPSIKFLATVLGMSEQHEAAVLASRFRNLHLWGCW